MSSSSKSARDNDYTSLDFLQGVHNQLSQLRTPSVKVWSQTQHNLNDSNRINKNGLQNSSPIIQMHSQLETVKLIRSHSLEDADHTPQLKQFKKFYDILVNDLYDPHDVNIMWAQFEASYGDFVMYQMFIDSLTKKIKRMKDSIKKKETIASNVQNIQMEIKQNADAVLNRNKKQANEEKLRVKAMSCLKNVKGKDRSTSLRAVGKVEKQKMRSKMKKQMGYILKVIKHGGIFIHS